MKAVVLEATERTIIGKKVKKLRKEGLLPVGLYGKDVKSVALSVKLPEFMKVYSKAGMTGLVELKYGSSSVHTLISNVQFHAVNRQPLHAEFHAVKLTEKIKANVPLEIFGESPAVANNVGILMQTLNEVEVEALPTDLPEKIAVDVTKLAEVGQQVTVGELEKIPGVEVLATPEEVIVKVVSAVSEETKKELEAEEAAKTAAASEAAAGAPAAGEAASVETATAPAAGDEKAQDKKPETN